MKRRALLSPLLEKTEVPAHRESVAVFNGTLSPYNGPWTFLKASHLLRRSYYGPTYEEIQAAEGYGMAQCINMLLSDLDTPEPPVHYEFMNDPDAGVGETWVNGKYYLVPGLANARNASMAAWQIGQMVQTKMSVREKMTLFWHNHFVVADITDGRFIYRYGSLLREYALGNFKELTKKITIDPSMLRYLNGNQNTKQAPNENYARELLELFTVGKGELAGPGDYSTFTEDDVVAMAKVLTGWVDTGYNNPILSDVGSVYLQNRHDTGNKQLSARFNNAVINNNNENEYADLIDVIFESDAVAEFLARKLYRWFLYYNIDETIEMNIIQPMAQMIRDNDYNVKPAIEALLSSEHFYEADHIGCMIKNPLDHLLGFFNQFEIEPEPVISKLYPLWAAFYNFSALLQMQMFAHPSVAGWKAYYQAPSYYQIWINSVTLPLRTYVTDIGATIGFGIGDENIKIEPLELITKFENPLDINELLADLSKMLYPKLLKENQIAALKEIVIPGLPDFEWTVEYSDYLADPDNQVKKLAVESKLRSLLVSMLRMPEYHLS